MKWSFNSCERRRQDISLLASGALTDAEASGIKKHLAECAECRRYFEEVKTVAAPLANWEGEFARIQPSQAAQNRWRRAVETTGQPKPERDINLAAGFRGWWQDVVWPSRRIWAGLATVWVLILAGNLSLRDHSRGFVSMSSAPQQEMVMALKDRQSVLAELLGGFSGPHDADRQKFFLPKPRSEHLEIFHV